MSLYAAIFLNDILQYLHIIKFYWNTFLAAPRFNSARVQVHEPLVHTRFESHKNASNDENQNEMRWNAFDFVVCAKICVNYVDFVLAVCANLLSKLLLYCSDIMRIGTDPLIHWQLATFVGALLKIPELVRGILGFQL